MVAPIVITLGKMLGEPAAKKVWEWSRGNEAERLVKLLKPQFPDAHKLLTQPSVLVELYVYAETGVFKGTEMVKALRAITGSPAQAAALTEAIRENQWRAMREPRQMHFELRRLRDEIGGDVAAGGEEVVQRITEALDGLSRRLPVARQLPAQTAPFVDRDRELAEAQRKLATPAVGHVALVVNCTGMSGTGTSAFALELAYRQMSSFGGGVLYADMRSPDGRMRDAADLAGRLLRDLGVGPDAIPEDTERRLALWRSVCAEEPVMIVLDNAPSDGAVAALIPSRGESIVIVTSRAPVAALASAGVIELAEMAEIDGLGLLEAIVGERVREESEAAREIVGHCCGLPLALAVTAGRLRAQTGATLTDMARALAASEDILGGLDDRVGTIRATLTSGLSDVGSDARRVLLLLAALEVSDVEPALVAAIAGCDTTTAGQLLEELGEQRLITALEGGGWRIHDLLRRAASQLAWGELGEQEISSALDRRVRWLVETAREHADDLEGEA